MKKIHLFPLLSALFFVGCSQDEVVPGGENVGDGSNTSYMAVNLISSDISGSRAKEGYEDGSDVENKVNNVRFYFFNEVGATVNVKLQNGSYVNYFDWTPKAGDQSPDTNDDDDIESNLTAIVVINTAKGDKIPQRMAAVLNPPTINGTPLLPDQSISLNTLKEKVANFSTTDLTKEGGFVMFNSVYASGGEQISTAFIKAENLCKDETAAKASPVTIYVERSVAKVKVTLGDDVKAAAESKLALKNTKGEDLTIDGQQVYLKLDGWSLTAETSEGRLVKRIDPTWPRSWWNDSYRSYWAINSMTAKNLYYDYKSIKTSFGADNALYTNENAQLNDIDDTNGQAQKKTKVIIKGNLQKADGTALTIVRHLGAYFVDDVNLTVLKGSILRQLEASGYNYYFEDGNKRTQIGANEIEISIVPQKDQEDSQNNCYVYAQLTEAAKTKTWYNSLDESASALTPDEVNGINENLANTEVVDRALVWKSGMTYYYYEIKHLPESNMKGVVRNHVYVTNVTKIAGLGTPVYDPDEEIYPEKPDPNDHYIAAEIKILSWRIVNGNYPLEW